MPTARGYTWDQFCAMFKTGQRVVCINDTFDPLQVASIPNRPTRDKQYIVRDSFQVTRNGTVSGIWALHLREIKNPHLPHPSGLGTFEPSFASDRFATVADDQATHERAVDVMLRQLEKEVELEVIAYADLARLNRH